MLLGAIGCTFLAIILIQHQIRHLETRFAQTLQKETVLKEDWGKLNLELHHLTALARVEKIAKERLNLQLPKPSELESELTIYLAPQTSEMSIDDNFVKPSSITKMQGSHALNTPTDDLSSPLSRD